MFHLPPEALLQAEAEASRASEAAARLEGIGTSKECSKKMMKNGRMMRNVALFKDWDFTIFFLWCFIYGNFKGGKYFPHRHSFFCEFQTLKYVFSPFIFKRENEAAQKHLGFGGAHV